MSGLRTILLTVYCRLIEGCHEFLALSHYLPRHRLIAPLLRGKTNIVIIIVLDLLIQLSIDEFGEVSLFQYLRSLINLRFEGQMLS